MTADPPASSELRGDPSLALVTAFGGVAARMQGLGCVNPKLAVAAIGFAPWSGRWLGVLLTPWFMNLVLAPRESGHWIDLAAGAARCYVFPAGEFEFIGARDDTFGAFQMCSLFSPVLEFADQESALLVGQLARDALFDAANAETPAMSEATAASPTLAERMAAPMSRRDLLRGRLVRTEDEIRR